MTARLPTLLGDNVFKYQRDFPDFRAFAIKLHGDQKYGDLPYAFHLAMVEATLVDYGFDSYDYLASAWLHDALEDTSVKLPYLVEAFNGKVGMWVFACTGVGSNRDERNQCIYDNLREIPEAAPVKVADRMVNTSNSYKSKRTDKLQMYLDEWPKFKENVRPLMFGDTRAMIMWNALEDFTEGLIEKNERSKSSNTE